MTWITETNLETIEDLIRCQLKSLFDIELRLNDLLPRLRDAAHDAQLKDLIEEHHDRTTGQIERLEAAFALMGAHPERVVSHAMRGIAHECELLMAARGDPDVLDAALIAYAQNIAHYEIAGYGCARAWAHAWGREDLAGLMQEALDEEREYDRRLTALADQAVNAHAVHPT
ncbi:MAG TPA: DUF892 family protein [Planctomycetota bacterium]|nr:DUF892 family protein [Planctomycetota bacterium]